MTELVDLHAKHISVKFQNGLLRFGKFGTCDLFSMIYFAVRDKNWKTIKSKIKNLQIQEWDRGFLITYNCQHKENDIDFEGKCIIKGEPTCLSFQISGEAQQAFLKNRIGFCIHHPMSYAGKAVTLIHTDGSKSQDFFPEYISADQPFKNLTGMEWKIGEAVAKLHLEGETFEMEDHRNWLDASFKTYCTPLDLPFPVAIKKGDQINQQITLDITPQHGLLKTVPAISKKTEANTLFLNGKISPLPLVGLESNRNSLSTIAIEKLSEINLSFLRVEARIYQRNWQNDFKKKLKQSQCLQLPVELVLILREGQVDELEHLATANVTVKHILLVDANSKTTGEPFLKQYVKQIKKLFPGVPVGGGTDYFFTELNRFPPPMHMLDFISFSINPQVHANDDLTLIENLQAFAPVIKSAHHYFKDLPIHISPITLKPRNNPSSTVPLNQKEIAELKKEERYTQEFGAMWTLCSLKFVFQLGVKSVTYFNTIGTEGILSESKSPTEIKTFPSYEIFNMIGDFKNGVIHHSWSNNPCIFDGLILLVSEKILW